MRKEFGSFIAVHDANFSIRRGEFFAMLGPSGCGKTTTLRMIAGFDLPTSGKVLLENQDVTEVPPHKRNVNTVFQQYALFPHMSIRENVAFGLRSKGGVEESEIRRRVGDMLDIVRLGQFADRRPAQLSGGQQQRVALARALVNMPSALLLDEPLAALDLKLRQAMQIELKRIQREVGITFIFVTHDQEEALTMSDRIAVMSEGYVEQIGTPQDIYDRPATTFCANFIGSANMLAGTVAGVSGESTIVDLDSGARVVTRGYQGDVGERVTTMIRPERMHLATTDPQASSSLAATVRTVIFEGSRLKVLSDLADGSSVTAHVDPEDIDGELHPDDRVWLSSAPEAAYTLKGHTAPAPGLPTVVKLPVKQGINRRALLIGGGVVAAGAVGALFMSSGKSGGSDAASSDSGASLGGSLGSGATSLSVLNWTAYIDPTEDGAVGTVDTFATAKGVSVNYSEGFNDNNEIFNKEFQAVIGNGGTLAYDIVCPTYWMAARLKSLGWIEPLPFQLIPNYVNLEPQYLNLGWDRGAKYHLPWQAGITGVAYNAKLAGRELRSINDLFDPALKGKVAMLSEMRDTVGLVMLGMGHDPSALNEDAMNEALDKIEQAVADGQIRQFTGNEYLQSLENENFVACIAWSGDALQLTNPDVSFVVPEEGGMSWFDTMVIPKGAPNAVAAAKWMDYVYDPVNAARITAWVQYVSPVIGVRDELVKLGEDGAALAESPILFPDDETKSRLRVFAEIPDDVDTRITDRFLSITGA